VATGRRDKIKVLRGDTKWLIVEARRRPAERIAAEQTVAHLELCGLRLAHKAGAARVAGALSAVIWNSLAHAGLTSSVHTSRSGSRRSGSPWTTKVWP
jgi:hypothetical protein